MPFFETLDDKRPAPRSAVDAVAEAEKGFDLAEMFQMETAHFCFELDYIFRLFRFVVHENPYMRDEAVPVVALAAKRCIQGSSDLKRDLGEVLTFFRSKGVVPVSGSRFEEKCFKCMKGLSSGAQFTITDGKKYHAG